jgi:hypothetical protein
VNLLGLLAVPDERIDVMTGTDERTQHRRAEVPSAAGKEDTHARFANR